MSLKVKHRIDSTLCREQPQKALNMPLDLLERGYDKFRSPAEVQFKKKVAAEYAHVRKTRILPRKKGAA